MQQPPRTPNSWGTEPLARIVSVDRRLEMLRIVAIVTLGVEAFLQRLHHRTAAGQATRLDMKARVPQAGTDERLGALRIDALRRDHDDAARHLALHGEG